MHTLATKQPNIQTLISYQHITTPTGQAYTVAVAPNNAAIGSIQTANKQAARNGTIYDNEKGIAWVTDSYKDISNVTQEK